ncbi:type VI secretion system protein [Trinickia dinghuensis]|uniref:Type VI secretion protein n=1 Tax=Trinickia dinghuensis TaxID=2291023 RepID=A0A3D8JPC4_9BURK|nr:type VI secretion system protein [Trinickia dinghuensis]RDU94730.1 type VI secretion protein [Trinickia dinghuensis]
MEVLQKLIELPKDPSKWVPSPHALHIALFAAAFLLAFGLAVGVARKLWGALKPLIKAPKIPALCGCAPPSTSRLAGWTERASLAIDYLRTRREWRYATPWLLMLGQTAAGKTSLLGSVDPQFRQPLDEREQRMNVDGATWHGLSQGFMLDPDGKLPYAAANAVLEGNEPDEPDVRRWRKLLDQLDALRPERALDGIVLVVSARTFLQRDPAQCTTEAQNARQQLRTIEERLEFALPVYVIVTACDLVDGFSAFWRSQTPRRRGEIIGWSAPNQTLDDPPSQWGATIFEEIGGQLRALQVETAAHCDRIAPHDADPLFLYPRQFAQMQAPFQQWLSVVFQVSAWQTGFFLRGVYFTGAVAEHGEQVAHQDGPRTDVAFVNDLMLDKALAEKHLARPTRAGVWSRNLLIRRVQWLCVLIFSVLVLACGVRVYLLDAQIDRVVYDLKLMQQLQAPAPGSGCIQQAPVYQLIDQVARIDADAHSWLLPLSLIDSRLSSESARRVAEGAFKKVVLPGLACQMSQRAYQLSALAAAGVSASLDYTHALNQLNGYVQQVDTYEQNASRFQRLLGQTPYAKDRVPLPNFIDLVEYAYRAPLPASVKSRPGLLPAALESLTDQDFGGTIALPPQFKRNVGDHIVALATQTGDMMQSELQAGPTLLEQLEEKKLPILPHVQQFTQWLTWVRTSWLGSSATSNPILTVQNQLAASLQPLIANYGYPRYLLPQATAHLDSSNQYPLAMQTLNSMSLPGYGALFVTANDQTTLNPAMQNELAGLNALSSLSYMSITPVETFTCMGNLANWSSGLLKNANQYALDYQKFLTQPTLKNGQSDALYRQLAFYQLELAMHTSLEQAQAAAYTASGASSTTTAEAQQSADSSNFGTISPLLLAVQKQFSTLGMSGSSTQLSQCASRYTNAQLGHIALLAEQSQLYDPAYQPASSDPDAYFFDLGSTPVINDMLSRQVSRVQVLVGYAQPILNYLNQADPSSSSASTSANTSNAAYWNNTANEVQSYLQGKNPNGQAALINNLFLQLLPGLQNSTCSSLLAAYQSPPLGNDLFSSHRQELLQSAQMRCKGERYAQAQSAYQAVSSRFNRELAGLYPFGSLDANDAGIATVQAFFTDYDSKRASLEKQVAGLKDPYWKSVSQFLSQLDQVDAFLQGNLVPGSTPGDAPNPNLNLNVNFRALQTAANGSNQIGQMSLMSGAAGVSFPNGGSTMNWQFGQPLVLDLSWAGLSLWRPAVSVDAPDLQVEGNTASFADAGNWGLLRLIARHQPTSGPATDPHDPSRTLLQFDVAVLNSSSAGKPASDTAHVFLSLEFSNVNAKTSTPLKLPAVFPTLAP